MTNYWNEFERYTLDNQWVKPLVMNKIKATWQAITDEELEMKRIEREINDELEKYIYKKGEKRMLKIILRNIKTGKHHCYEVKEKDESKVKLVKIGQRVQYYDGKGFDWEDCKVVKIVANKPKSVKGVVFSEFASLPYGRTPFWDWVYDWAKEGREESQELKTYQKRPYFLARLDTIKGESEGKENLEKMKFPCFCIWKHHSWNKDCLGMLITGYPYHNLEYQLIDLSNQVPVNDCCSVGRDEDLGHLMERWNVEVIKGTANLYKVGGVNV